MANSVYEQDELLMLEKSKSIRLQIVDEFMKGGVPTNTSEVRVINELLTSLDKSVHDGVNNRIKHQDASNKEAILDMVAENIKLVARQKREIIPTLEIETELPEEYTEIETVPGEKDINPGMLSMKDILGNYDDN